MRYSTIVKIDKMEIMKNRKKELALQALNDRLKQIRDERAELVKLLSDPSSRVRTSEKMARYDLSAMAYAEPQLEHFVMWAEVESGSSFDEVLRDAHNQVNKYAQLSGKEYRAKIKFWGWFSEMLRIVHAEV